VTRDEREREGEMRTSSEDNENQGKCALIRREVRRCMELYISNMRTLKEDGVRSDKRKMTRRNKGCKCKEQSSRVGKRPCDLTRRDARRVLN